MEHVRQSTIGAAMKEPATCTLRSGELATLAGVSRDTLRYYERHRLLPAAPRSQNGYRRYPTQAVARIRLIRAALGIGFTIEELGEIFAARDSGQAPCRRVHALAIEKSRSLAKRIYELQRVHDALRAAIRSWGRKLTKHSIGATGWPTGNVRRQPPREPEGNFTECLSRAKTQNANKRGQTEMRRIVLKQVVLLALVIPATVAWTQAVHEGTGQDMKDCPMHQPATEQKHDHDLAKRGEQVMGFSQEKTTHHFLLSREGGAIQVTANASDDKTSVEQIRRHFAHIAQAFQTGDFDIPMFVHNQTPPGVAIMTKLKDQIQYKYEEMTNGGRVTITSKNAEAIQAVHDFLRFQISEHQTGDAQEVR